jgi:glycosyltransferase involved in cell wall biosynthesis
MSRHQTLMMATELFAPGGIQRVGRDVIDALTAGSEPVTVWSLRDAAIPAGYAVPDGAEIRLAAGSSVRLGSWAMVRAATRCDDMQVLLMHVHLAPIAVPMLARGARVALFLHGVEIWRPLSAAERFVLNRAARVIAISNYTARRFRDANPWFRGRIDICPLGVPSETCQVVAAPPAGNGWPALPAESRREDHSGHLALVVSRITWENRYKGHELLIRAWAAVRRCVPDATLVIVGDGDDRPRLEALTVALGLEGAVRFAGQVSDRELASWYARCTLFVMPSPDEGFGLVFLEAMRAGKACIGAAGAAAEVILDGVTGTIVPPGEKAPLIDAVVALFRDPARRERFGLDGRKRVAEAFTSAHFADRVRRLLNARDPSEDEAA